MASMASGQASGQGHNDGSALHLAGLGVDVWRGGHARDEASSSRPFGLHLFSGDSRFCDGLYGADTQGIAHNKAMAKVGLGLFGLSCLRLHYQLCSAWKKPAAQTVLRERDVLTCLETLPIKKVSTHVTGRRSSPDSVARS